MITYMNQRRHEFESNKVNKINSYISEAGGIYNVDNVKNGDILEAACIS